ncbi:hypothetical protein AtEden1_Chr3g0157961 [Arabidopsis thaliana]
MNHQKSFFLITFTKENKSRPSKSSVSENISSYCSFLCRTPKMETFLIGTYMVDEKKKLTWQSGESIVTNEKVTSKPLMKRLGCS